jgi:hypothetical protein
VSYFIVGLILICISAWTAATHHLLPDWFAKLVFCVASGFWGLAFRASWLTKLNLDSPDNTYFTHFLAIVLLNALLTYGVLHVVPGVPYSPVFFALSLPVNVVLGIFVHPDFWIVPKWLGSK